jgi:hypothetical protein
MNHNDGCEGAMVRIPSKQSSVQISSGNSDSRQTLVQLAIAALVRVAIWTLPSSGSRRVQ